MQKLYNSYVKRVGSSLGSGIRIRVQIRPATIPDFTSVSDSELIQIVESLDVDQGPQSKSKAKKAKNAWKRKLWKK